MQKLVRKKNFQNHLLWILAEDVPYTSLILDKLNNDLKLLEEEIIDLKERRDEDFYRKVKIYEESDFKHWHNRSRIMAYFKKHYPIVLEPCQPHTTRVPESKVIADDEVYY